MLKLGNGDSVDSKKNNKGMVPMLQQLVVVSSSPILTGAITLLADLASLAIAAPLAFLLKIMLDHSFLEHSYVSLWPLLFMFPIVFSLSDLYPGVGLSPVEELRRIVLGISVVYLGLAVLTFLMKLEMTYSRAVFLLAWGLSVLLVPLGRAALRQLFARARWWGVPIVIIGAGETGRLVLRRLQATPGLGLKPIALLDDDQSKRGVIDGVPVVGGLNLAPVLAKEHGIRSAIWAMPGSPRVHLLRFIELYGNNFSRLFFIPSIYDYASSAVSSRDLGGLLGLEVRQSLLLPGHRAIKRLMDLAGALLGGILLSPLLLTIAFLIKLDSPGPVFYGHERIGQGGRRFRAWKFRSMVKDADLVLKDYLRKHPEFREEWERDWKLRNDPRITRVGKFLRRTSLDELPQLWNVLKGEMSLVGPRPVVREELVKYGEKGAYYLKVRPGMTGLWQVSGRSDTSYAERVELDVYYVRNWSIWLDIYILARTVWVVLKGRGAY